jgi:hypothetical protein
MFTSMINRRNISWQKRQDDMARVQHHEIDTSALVFGERKA